MYKKLGKSKVDEVIKRFIEFQKVVAVGRQVSGTTHKITTAIGMVVIGMVVIWTVAIGMVRTGMTASTFDRGLSASSLVLASQEGCDLQQPVQCAHRNFPMTACFSNEPSCDRVPSQLYHVLRYPPKCS